MDADLRRDGTDASETVPKRGMRLRVRMPSAFIAIGASALTAAALGAQAVGSGTVVGVVGLAAAGTLTIIASLCLAEMRSTAPFSGGVWHFGRMVHGVPGGFMLAWLEVCAMSMTAALFLRTAAETLGSLVRRAALAGLRPVASATATFWLVGLPLAAAFVVWMTLAPATPRRKSLVWRRVLKWFSYAALTVGWGVGIVFIWQFLAGARSFAAPLGARVLPSDFAQGLLATLVCFSFVLHSVPGDAADPDEGRMGGQGEHRRYRLPRGILLGVLNAVLSASVIGLAAASVPVGGADGGLLPTGFEGPLAVATLVAAVGGCCFAIARGVRVMSAIAREGMLPPGMGRPSRTVGLERRRHARCGLGMFAVAGVCAWGADAWHGPALAAGLLHAALGAATCFVLVRLRKEVGDELDYGFVMPGFPWLPRLAGSVFLACALLIGSWDHSSIVALVAYGVSGLLLHEFYAREHSLARSEDVAVIQEDVPESSTSVGRHTMRVLVAAADSTTASRLLRMARRLCGRQPTVMGLLHMVTVPESVRIAEAARDVSQAQKIVAEEAAQLASESIALRTLVRYCRSVARGILTTVRESRTDLLVLGWHGRLHRGQNTAWGRTLDPVLRRAPCNVVVAKGLAETQEFRRILVPILDPFHGAFALNVASRLAVEGEDAQIELFAVHGASVDDVDVRAFLRQHSRRIARMSVRIVCRSDVYGSAVEGILEEILRGQHDLVVLGATPPQQAAVGEGSLATMVAARAKVPCVMVSAASPWTLWRNRWLRAD